ncbi:substrate-binding domain-containing protein [Microbacterium luteum]|uniref:sugar ABC transporter substrate-binding protein n=1 Tax=Microbacterium TaxID=33882 RepID=UPI00188817B8|nr:substrate-binding domain-containing protein [Microbacterium luteum]
MSALLLAALVISGCSSDTETPNTGGGSGDISAEAQAALDRAYEGVGSDLSGLEPVTVPDDLSVYVMSCGEQLATCHQPAAAVVEGAEAAGWSGQIVDGKLSPEGFATAIRQAVAGGADVLVPIGISCSAAAAAFKEAADAGVTIIGGGGVDDCDPAVWDSERLWLADAPQTGFFGVFGELMADYAYGKNPDGVKAIVINSTTNAWGPWITQGFEDQLAELDGGEVLDTIDVSDPETADNSYLQKVTSALLANPDANTLIVPTDSYLETGLAAAVDQAGFADQLTVIGAFGGDGAIDMIRSGQPGITATVAMGNSWQGWGSIDTAIRVLNGQDVAYIGQSVQVVDADNNLPESGSYEGSIDFRTKFLEAWGK